MLLAKKLLGLVVLVTVPGMFWQAGAYANTAGHNRVPSVLLKAERAVRIGELDRAFSLLEESIDDLPNRATQAEAYALLCQAHYQKQDYLAAESFCDLAANTGRPNWSHLNNRGVMRFKLGRYTEALADFRHAASIMLSASRDQSRSIRRNVSAAQQRVAAL